MELLIDNRAKKIYQEFKNGMKKLMQQLVSTVIVLLGRLYLFSKIGFGLKPFLTAGFSEIGIQNPALALDYWLSVRYKLIVLIRWLYMDHELFNQAEHDIQQKALKKFQMVVPASKRAEEIPLPEVYADISPEEFYDRFVKIPHPVVIRGLAKELTAVKKWNKSFFKDSFGDTKLLTDEITYDKSSINDPNAADIKFKEKIRSLKEAFNSPGVYINANQDIFKQHPQLNNDLSGINEWKKYLGKNAFLLMSQLFFGWHTEGAPLHCANAWNFFIMVDGEKEWTFIDPEYSLQIGAIVHPTVVTIEGCATGKIATWRDSHELFSEFCPKFKVTLKKGDVILNPPWWWHEIKNVTPFSIGVSSRWLVPRYQTTNGLFDFLFCLSPNIWKAQREILKEKVFKDSPAGQDFIREYAKRDHSDENKYFQDFLNRSKQKIFE
jgi:hypothetical protein